MTLERRRRRRKRKRRKRRVSSCISTLLQYFLSFSFYFKLFIFYSCKKKNWTISFPLSSYHHHYYYYYSYMQQLLILSLHLLPLLSISPYLLSLYLSFITSIPTFHPFLSLPLSPFSYLSISPFITSILISPTIPFLFSIGK